MSIQLKNLKIANDTFGKTFFLVNQTPYFDYVEGKKTDKVLGQAFDIAVLEQDLEKIRVKIPNPSLKIDTKDKKMLPVEFENLEISLYQDFRQNNQIKFKATATNIKKTGGNENINDNTARTAK